MWLRGSGLVLVLLPAVYGLVLAGTGTVLVLGCLAFFTRFTVVTLSKKTEVLRVANNEG